MLPPTVHDTAISPNDQRISLVEALLIAAVIVGHNVWGVVPNEILLLTPLAIVSMRWRTGGWHWRSLGFQAPRSWSVVIGVALLLAATRIVLGDFVLVPLAESIWPPIKAPGGTDEITGNLAVALQWLALVWTFAAVGEEIVYRGFLLNRLADVGRRSTLGFGVAIFASAALFGVGHFYKGPAGVLDSTLAGLILGLGYVLTGRCLWTSVLTHGFIDTFAVLAEYLGWSN